MGSRQNYSRVVPWWGSLWEDFSIEMSQILEPHKHHTCEFETVQLFLKTVINVEKLRELVVGAVKSQNRWD